jgi:tRNA-binding EMAP/Myf-like protein
MTNYEYERLLSATVDNALLYLWINVASSKRRVPTTARNKLLVAWLKPKIKDAKYKIIKSELKSMILSARDKNGRLEEGLIRLHELSQKHRTQLNDMYKFNHLLHQLKDLDYASELYEIKEQYDEKTIYFSEEEIESCFTESNQQIASIHAYASRGHMDAIVDTVNQIGSHLAKRLSGNENGLSKFTLSAPLAM